MSVHVMPPHHAHLASPALDASRVPQMNFVIATTTYSMLIHDLE
jgi:hypothetical protein